MLGGLCLGGCCIKKVLLWNTNCNVFATGLSEAKTMFTANGIAADKSADYNGNIDDYSLIIWAMAESDPPWWAAISGRTWAGRFHITAEFGGVTGGFTATRNYVNSKSGLHGITVSNDLLFPSAGCNANVDPVEAHQLTDGVTTITHAASASVTGGTALSKTSVNAWIAQNKAGLIDWVVAGDSNHVTDNCGGVAALNATFLKNLYNKPIP